MFDNVWSLCIMALVVLGSLYWAFVHPFTKLAAAGIPGPKPWPVIGNLLDFMGEKEASAVERGYVKKYGKVCGYYAGRDPMVLVSDPKILRRILVKDFHIFNNRPTMEVKMLYGPGRRAIIHLKNDDWKRVRAIISPVFSSSKMKQMVPVMKESLDTLMKIMEKKANSEKSCNVYEIFILYTMETILSLAFGIKTETQKDPSNSFNESAKGFFQFDFLFMLTKIIPFFGRILHGIRLLLGPPQSIKFLTDASQRIIATRRKTARLSKRQDLLDLMLNAQLQDENGTIDRLTDDEIIGQAIAFMLGGPETTASSLSLTAYSLALHPEYQEKAIEEIKEKLSENEEVNYDNIQKLEYLDMIFAENLRIFTPINRFDRLCKESCTIDGVKFKAGFNIGIIASQVHMNPEYWPDPNKFDPERFTPEAKAERDPFCYLPFGGGPRYCPGMRFGNFQAKMVLAIVLRKYKFAIAPETEIPPKRRSVSGLEILDGVWLMIQKQE